MDDSNQDGSEVLETTENETEVVTEEVEALEEETEDVEALKVKNKQLYARAKKAEGFVEVDGKWVKKPAEAKAPLQNLTLSVKDQAFLAKVDIHDDDFDEVLELAALKKISVREAHEFMKPILDQRTEERKTAAATQTGRSARGSAKTSGEDLLKQAEKTGEFPETDAGMRELAEARLARRRAGNK